MSKTCKTDSSSDIDKLANIADIPPDNTQTHMEETNYY